MLLQRRGSNSNNIGAAAQEGRLIVDDDVHGRELVLVCYRRQACRSRPVVAAGHQSPRSGELWAICRHFTDLHAGRR